MSNDIYTIGLMIIEFLRFYEISGLRDKLNPTTSGSNLINIFMKQYNNFTNYKSNNFSSRPSAEELTFQMLKLVHNLRDNYGQLPQLNKYLSNEKEYYDEVALNKKYLGEDKYKNPDRTT